MKNNDYGPGEDKNMSKIKEIKTMEGLNELALFAGAGGGILGGHLLGWKTVCAVELDEYARSVLIARQNDGCLPPFPIWDDVRTFDGHPWRGIVDVVSGGFPCQDISCAGKGAGITGERSRLWGEMARIVGEVRPRFVLVENSPLLVGRGLAVVLGDLATLGYDAKWGIVGAHHAGAPHKRDRIWILGSYADGYVADTNQNGRNGQSIDAMPCQMAGEEKAKSRTGYKPAIHLDGCGSDVPNADLQRLRLERDDWWEVEPDVGRVAHGVANRVDRLRCIGNGQVPAVAALAWRVLGGFGMEAIRRREVLANDRK